MKPPAFDYNDPGTLDEAIADLAHSGDDAKLIAGGQSLVPLLNFRLASPSCLIDLNKVAGLAQCSLGDGVLKMGQPVVVPGRLGQHNMCCEEVIEVGLDADVQPPLGPPQLGRRRWPARMARRTREYAP